jgi:hypothetical protein
MRVARIHHGSSTVAQATAVADINPCSYFWVYAQIEI